jgi:prepilin-type N-terminal cleavage/methylation domain-containing protein
MRVTDQRGMSLTELSIAMGLMGGIALVTTKILEDQKGHQAVMTRKVEVAKAVSVLKTALNNAANCRAMLGGKTLSDPTNPTAAVSLNELRLPVRLEAGTNYTETSANSLLLLRRDTAYTGFETGKIRLFEGMFRNQSPPTPGTAFLEVEFYIKGLPAEAKANRFRLSLETFPLTVSKDGSNRVTNCGIAVTAAEVLSARQKFCRSLQPYAAWNAVTSKCEYSGLNCPYGKVPTYVASTGGTLCTDVRWNLDLHDLFDATPCTSGSSRYTIDSSSGKLRIQCL